MTQRFFRSFPWTACLLATTLVAQDTPKPDFTAKQALIRQALEASMAETSLAISAKTKVDSQFARAFAGRGGANERTFDVTWTPQLLHVGFGDGSDEAVFAGRRMITRSKADAWAVRSGKLGDGRALPHFFDPEVLLRVLALAKPEILHSEVGALDDHPIEILTARLEGDAARELTWNSFVPEGSELGGFAVFAAGVGGVQPAPPRNDVEIDLAFSIDPASKRLLRLRAKVYMKSANAMGQVVIARAGGAIVGGQEEEEDEEEADKPEKGAKKAATEAPLKFVDGLPVRTKPKKENWTIATNDLRFHDHGTAKVPELDPAARNLLGLPAAK